MQTQKANLPIVSVLGYALALLVSAVYFSSCSPDVRAAAKERVFAELFVRYLSDTRELKAHAIFAVGDSASNAKPKTWPGGVSFLNSGMVARDLQGQMVRYQYINPDSDFPATAVFTYTDDSGQRREHNIEMAPITDFSIEGNISLNKGMTLQTVGGSLVASESIVLLFSDAKNQASSITIQGPSASSAHFIPGPNLSNLTLGKGQLYLVKKKAMFSQQNEAEQKIVIEYYTSAKDVEVGN